MKIDEVAGVGIIDKYNTTVDVKPGETERQAAKLFPMNKGGKPQPLHAKAAKNSTPNKLFNLGISENISHTAQALKDKEKKLGLKPGDPGWFKLWFDLPLLREGKNKSESYLLQLERDYDADMLVLHVKDNRTGARTEVRGKLGYETNGYDPTDRLHIILDEIGKAANISELMNGEVVSINPNHPEGEKAKAVARQLTKEDITTVDLQQLETFADKLFGKVGIDVEFTRHFLDRVNDIRNQKPITMSELTRLFKQEYKRWGKPIAQMGPGQEAVMKDLQTDINLPFALRWDEKNQELDLIAKTIMRKKGFRTPNQEFPVENAPGSLAQKINWAGQNQPPVKKPASSKQASNNQNLSWWQRLQQRVMGEEEIQEETPWEYIGRKASVAFNADRYEKAAKYLHKILLRKHEETGGKLRHTLGYYAQMLARQTGDKINWKELRDYYLAIFGEQLFENFAKGSELDSLRKFVKSQREAPDQVLYQMMMAPDTYGHEASNFVRSWYENTKEENGLNDVDSALKIMVDQLGINENFADGKVKGKSRPGRVKRAGASCDGSVSELRRKAKNSSGEKAKMYHWCANMKSGRKK